MAAGGGQSIVNSGPLPAGIENVVVGVPVVDEGTEVVIVGGRTLVITGVGGETIIVAIGTVVVKGLNVTAEAAGCESHPATEMIKTRFVKRSTLPYSLFILWPDFFYKLYILLHMAVPFDGCPVLNLIKNPEKVHT